MSQPPPAPLPTAPTPNAHTPNVTPRWWTVPRTWTARQWRVAALAAVGTVALIGIPTAVIPNPVFGRAIEPTWWSLPALLVTAVLGGLLLATYVRPDGPAAGTADGSADGSGDDRTDRPARWGTVGGFLAYFAIGCPVCNKLVLIALGSSGAVTFFAPVQPLLALASVVLIAVALRARLRGALSCPVPGATDPGEAVGADGVPR